MSSLKVKVLSIDISANDGAVLRVLGLTERRGHRVQKMHAYMPSSTSFKLEVQIEEGTPRQDVLIHQVKRLPDVVNAKDITAA